MVTVVENLTLGRGDVYFGKFKDSVGQVPDGERLFGNTPSLNIAMTSEKLEHYSSARGRKVLDRTTTTQTGGSGTMSTDNIDKENVAILFLGTALTLTTASATGRSDTFVGVKKGMSYQLGTTLQTPSGVRKVTTVVVKVGSDIKVLGTDYELDADRARVWVIPGGSIAANATLTVEYGIAASTRDQIISGQEVIEGSMRFLAYNAEGANIDYFMPWVKLSPSGDFSLKGDDWMAITYQVDLQRKTGLELLYADGQPVTT